MGDAHGGRWRRAPRGRRGRRGSALVYALASVMLVAGLAASFLQVSTGIARRQSEAIEKKQAFYLAEAGLIEAVAGLQVGHTGNLGSALLPAAFGGGLLWVEATEHEDDLVELECYARAGASLAHLSLWVEQGQDTVASLGFFGGQSLELNPGTTIDAYESHAGGSGEQPAVMGGLSGATGGTGGGTISSSGGDGSASSSGFVVGSASSGSTTELRALVGSNGPVTILGSAELPTTVEGDVFAGLDDVVTVGSYATVTGLKRGGLNAFELPEVDVPDCAPAAGIVHSSAVPLVLNELTAAYESLEVSSGAEVVVQGPTTLVLGSLLLRPGSSLTLDASSGPIQVVFTGSVGMYESSNLVVTPDDPTQVTFQMAGPSEVPHRLFASGEFHGLIYAPESEVRVASSLEVFGAAVADRLAFVGPVALHYDQTLARAALVEGSPRIVSWRLIELESQPNSGGADPFVLQGVDRSLSPLPAAAHEDQVLDLTYYDTFGGLQSYSGMESAFDWSTVNIVVSASRDGEVVQSASKTVRQVLDMIVHD